jgi:hypothetical protein
MACVWAESGTAVAATCGTLVNDALRGSFWSSRDKSAALILSLGSMTQQRCGCKDELSTETFQGERAHLQQRLNAGVNKVEVGAKGVLRIFEK